LIEVTKVTDDDDDDDDGVFVLERWECGTSDGNVNNV